MERNMVIQLIIYFHEKWTYYLLQTSKSYTKKTHFKRVFCGNCCGLISCHPNKAYTVQVQKKILYSCTN